MTSKHFCLKWTRFESNILSAFESLQSTEDLADVTLTCDGINIKAHKFILSACSPYFRTVFKENPCPHPIVILKDVAHADLMAIINFMYHGEVTVSEEQLSSFLNTAVILQVLGLMNDDDHPRGRPKGGDAAPESPSKKAKLSSKRCEVRERFETVDIKTEDGGVEGVETSRGEEERGSILEAALEKPSSILERSLTAQAGKSPAAAALVFHGAEKPPTGPPDGGPPKTVYILRKPPETEAEKRCSFSSSTEGGGGGVGGGFEFLPAEFLQQRMIKTEDGEGEEEEVEGAKKEGQHGRGGNSGGAAAEGQPAHHSSQCGNCPHCGKVYSNQSALKYHVRLVHSDLSNMYCCHLCPESFDYREGYKKHMADVHLIRN